MRMSSNKLSLVGLKRIVAVFMCVIYKRVYKSHMSISCCDPIGWIDVTPIIALHYSKKVFEENLTDAQFSYRDGCSCADASIQTQYNYLRALDDKDCSYVSFLQLIFQKPLITCNTY